MRNYGFSLITGYDGITVKEATTGEKLFEITFSENSAVYLDIAFTDGKYKQRLSVEEVIDNMPDATAEDLKAFCGFIFLLGRRM
jgi:hypothetical protein